MFTETLEHQTQAVLDMVHDRPRPISSRLHSRLDFATVAKMLTIPRLLGAKREVTNAVTLIALFKLIYSLLTKHEGGVYKVIPLKTHLAIDAAAGVGLAAVPFILDEENDYVTWFLVGMGLFDIAAAPLTETPEPYEEELMCWSGFRPIVDQRFETGH